MSMVRPPKANPYSTSMLLGRSMPVTSCRSAPSSPKTATPPSGAATLIVPSTRLCSGAVGWTQMAGSSGSWASVAVARAGVTLAMRGAPESVTDATRSARRQEPAATHSAAASPATKTDRSRTSGTGLEVVPEHELDLPRRAGAVASVERTGDAPERRRRCHRRARCAQIDAIERVERLESELEVLGAADGEAFLQRQVDLEEARR